jgi:drug/metabolite transporter (DMT)-like permease
MTTTVALGALAAVGAAVCYELSYAVQARESRRVPTRRLPHVSLLTRLARRPRWLVGVALAAVAWPLQLLALSRAPLTLVQPILALGVVLLLVLAARTLSEQIGARELVYVGAIVVGVAGIAWAAPQHSSSHAGPWALAIALGALTILILLPYGVGVVRRGAVTAALLVLAAGAGDAWAAFGSKLLVDELSRGKWLVAVAFGVGAAIAAGAGFLSETSALQRYPASRVGPGVLAMQVAIPVALAALVGGEDWGDTPLGGAVLGLSLLVVTISGVLLTTALPALRSSEDERGSRGELGEAEVGRGPLLEGSEQR